MKALAAIALLFVFIYIKMVTTLIWVDDNSFFNFRDSQWLNDTKFGQLTSQQIRTLADQTL